MRLRVLLAVCIVAGLALPATAAASQIVARNARYPAIKVMVRKDGTQVAMVSFLQHGLWHHVLLWGAVNARRPDPLHPRSQVAFHVDYSGGYGSFGAGYWKIVKARNVCGPYQGPGLPWRVAACTMPNGSNWALQAWQRELLDMGVMPRTALQSAWELHASHWSGALPVLWLKWGWAYSRSTGHYDHLYGQLSYHGYPVYGFSATGVGSPTDPYGRNIYVDTQDSAWHGYRQANGWYRWNAFLAHRGQGDFCASVYSTMGGVTQPVGGATAYRATVEGPGVTPVVVWKGGPPGYYVAGSFPTSTATTKPIYTEYPATPPPTTRGPFDKSDAIALNDEQRALAGSSDSCYTVYGPHS